MTTEQKQEEEMKTDIANEVFNKIIEYGISKVEFWTTEEGERRGSFVFNGGQIVKIDVTSKVAHEGVFDQDSFKQFLKWRDLQRRSAR